MTGITPSAENLRAEMARHQLSRPVVCKILDMHVNSLSNYIGGYRPLPEWVAHNVAYAINKITGLRIFEIEMGRGIVPMERAPAVHVHDPRKPRKPSVRLTSPSDRRRRKKNSSGPYSQAG